MHFGIKSTISVAALSAALAGGIFVGQATAQQPHMESALSSLRAARSELAVATHNKGGHRVAALGYVDQAISEVKAGIADGM